MQSSLKNSGGYLKLAWLSVDRLFLFEPRSDPAHHGIHRDLRVAEKFGCAVTVRQKAFAFSASKFRFYTEKLSKIGRDLAHADRFRPPNIDWRTICIAVPKKAHNLVDCIALPNDIDLSGLK